jgi:hypothetical protein
MEMTNRERYIREVVMPNHSDIVRRAIERLMNQVCEEVVNVHVDIEEKDVGAFVSTDEYGDTLDEAMTKEAQTEYDMRIIQRLLLETLARDEKVCWFT